MFLHITFPEWKSSIFKKHELYNTYWQQKSKNNWSNFRKQRNLCERLKRKSVKKYMQDKCVDSKSNPGDFWKIVSPHFSDKSKSNSTIQLIENDKFISDPRDVVEVFNQNYSTVADSIGIDSIYSKDLTNHPSFNLITKHMESLGITDYFNFKTTSVPEIEKILNKLDPKKATGYDGIPPKALKASSEAIAPTVCKLVNNMVTQSLFPEPCKKAEVAPLYKMVKSRLAWTNFRPVSVLTCLSKVFEIVMSDQMQPWLDNIFSIYLSAYRKKFGCHSVLIHSTETWKRALDNKQYVGIIMSDLSKAFDCLPHDLLLEKLRYYNFSVQSIALLRSYLTNRSQRVKLGQVVSSWATLTKGVPQGSVVGPQCFNIHLNDLLLDLVYHDIIPSNYADDNSTSVVANTKAEVLERVQDTLKILVTWFKDNLMKANVDKFQFMLLCPNAKENKQTHVVQFNDVLLSSQDGAKLLGIHIDRQLTFNTHVKNTCAKANAKLQALKRLTNYLTLDCKMAVVRSFIVSHFIYCAPLFHFSGKKHRDKIEKILCRGLRYVFNDYESTYEELLKKAEMCSVELLREKAIICEVYKCLHGLGPHYMREIFQSTGVDSRKGPTFVQPRVNTTYFGLHSLRHRGPKLWNALPMATKLADTETSLKTMLANYEGVPCRCALCR